MHYHAEVWIPNLQNIEAQVEAIMAPHKEQWNEENGHHTGFWDWYQIGGRWTGYKTKYKPEDDPRNIEGCWLCGGTGIRSDFPISEGSQYNCNGCCRPDKTTGIWQPSEKYGLGKRLKWPTEWVDYDNDTLPLNEINDDITSYTLIVGDKVFTSEIWNGTTFVETDFNGKVKEQLINLGITDGYLVTVDYHC